ncbi:AI-2E family transporter [Labrys wisconsinensis]|uniref:PurR-regulated permease PerM n=1 Tax=Labrys wisconsinensis TaxID=425677 RepID=A0ABU0J404_9HYPH|nr:AI-2E family transporter [Labrys wisconsinensis]MDQ0468345.1 putative PurR-regulated permease PerM [Labrys wisconsinensis]
MTFQRQLAFWIGALVVLVLLLWLLSGVMLPFVAGIVVAYFLNPVADRFVRLGLPRWAAASVILLIFVMIFVTALLLLVPILGDQLAGFRARLPSYISSLQRILAELNSGWLGTLIGDRLPDIQKSLADSVGQGASMLGSFVASIWSGGQAIFSVISVLVVTPVVAFYILLDWNRMVGTVDNWLPRQHVATIRGIAGDIDRAIAGFVRGQATVCLLLGLFYGTGLSVVGLSFGFLIGLCAGFVSFIPYVGSILGFVVAMGVALVQSWPGWHLPALVAVVFGIGQFLEGNILSPRLVGSSVGLHPVWLMFALLAAGSLFGFVGLMVAVPVAAAIGVLVRFALGRYLDSPLYTGEAPAAPAKAEVAE